MQEDFKKHIMPYMDSFIKITLSPEELDKALAFAEKKAKAKAEDPAHKTDRFHEVKRNMTGIMGEMAIEKLLNISFIDWTVATVSKAYRIPDISPAGYNVGVKCVEFGKFPVVNKWNKNPQIICMRTTTNEVLICGLATTEVLNKYQCDDMILSPMLRARGVKTGFIGFSELIPVNTSNLEAYKIASLNKPA